MTVVLGVIAIISFALNVVLAYINLRRKVVVRARFYPYEIEQVPSSRGGTEHVYGLAIEVIAINVRHRAVTIRQIGFYNRHGKPTLVQGYLKDESSPSDTVLNDGEMAVAMWDTDGLMEAQNRGGDDEPFGVYAEDPNGKMWKAPLPK